MPFGLRLAKGVLSAGYWFGCLYLASGLFMGDRVTAEGIVASSPLVPFWAFALLAVGLYAALSLAWDRLVLRD